VTTYSVLLDTGVSTLTGRAFFIDAVQTGTPGLYRLVGSDAVTLIHHPAGGSMPVAISAIDAARIYRLDVTAPEDTETVTLFVDGVRYGRVDKFPPWVFTCELATRETPYILEARIEGPFGTLTAYMQLPEHTWTRE
jgi:hypothetical protein